MAFGQEEMLRTETVQVGYEDRGWETSPFVLPGASALVVGGRQRRQRRITSPNIRIKTPVNPGDLSYEIGLNEDPFTSNNRDLNRRLQRRVAKVQMDLDARIANTEEWMCCRVLFEGILTVSVPGEDSFVIDYDRPAANTVVLGATALWTAATAFPELQFREATQKVSQDRGVQITDVFLGHEAAIALLQNEGVQRRLHQERYNIGALDLTRPFTEDGSLNFIGRLANVRIWEYVAQVNLQGVATQLIDPKNAEFFSTQRNANQVFTYAPISDDFDAIRRSRGSVVLPLSPVGTMVKRFSKAWQSPDPSSMNVLMASRPLPVTHTPDASITYQVVA